MIRYRQVLVCCFLLSLMVLFFLPAVSAQDDDPFRDPTTIVLKALTESDSLVLQDDPEVISSSISDITSDLKRAKELYQLRMNGANISDGNDTIVQYIQFWIGFEEGYGDMVSGSSAKQQGYDALMMNTTGSFSEAYDAFVEAEEFYQSARDQYTVCLDLLYEMDEETILVQMPEASIPRTNVIDEIIFRLTDNIAIITGYQHLCKAEMLKIQAGNISTFEAEDELRLGKDIMQSLIHSPYVGSEAALFTNISF